MTDPQLPRREASAEIRQGVTQLRGVFLALMDEGFTEPQALIIIGHILAGAR